MTAGLIFKSRMISSKWSAIWPTVFRAITSGFAFASWTVEGSSGQPGVSAVYPAASNISVQRFQLLGSNQSPWTNTTGCLFSEFARSTWRFSNSTMVSACSACVSLDRVLMTLLLWARSRRVLKPFSCVRARPPLHQVLRDQLGALPIVPSVDDAYVLGIGTHVNPGRPR